MYQSSRLKYRAIALFLFFSITFTLPARSLAQSSTGWQLDKMPADLETDLALSSLPPNLRAGATVYLLDPAKGYYVGRQGSNGFICFVTRTNWEWSEFRQDVYAPMGYDAEGARTIYPMYRDAAAMRASGRFDPGQIRDSVVNRIGRGMYVAPAKAGLSYMLAPIMRVYTGKPGDRNVMTMSMPHYMFYAPYITSGDEGLIDNSPNGPWLLNSGNAVLGAGKGPEGYFIVPADMAMTEKIREDGKDLLKRLANYSAWLKVDVEPMHH